MSYEVERVRATCVCRSYGRERRRARDSPTRSRELPAGSRCPDAVSNSMANPRRHLRLLADTFDWESRIRGLRVLTGNTPLLAIECEVFGQPRTIYAKAENLNFTGSIKDRMALHILRRAYETGALEPGGRSIEAARGDTGSPV